MRSHHAHLGRWSRRHLLTAPRQPGPETRVDVDRDLAAALPRGLREALPHLSVPVLVTAYSLAHHGHSAPYLAQHLLISLNDADVVVAYAHHGIQ
jgi:hypothetical protein